MHHKQKGAFHTSKLYYSIQKINLHFRLFTSMEELRNMVEFPCQADFFSKLKQETVSDEMYNDAKRLYENRRNLPKGDPNKWYNMGDYLRYYNLLDVEPLKIALKSCFENYRKYFNVDGLSFLSLPRIGFESMYRLFDKKLPLVVTFNKSLVGDAARKLFRENVLGGLSTVFHRLVTPAHTYAYTHVCVHAHTHTHIIYILGISIQWMKLDQLHPELLLMATFTLHCCF